MTTENAYVKLAAVTQQLGEERTKNDTLTTELSILREDFNTLQQAYRDLHLKFEQYRERYPNAL